MSEWVSTTLGEVVEVRVSNVDKKSVDGETPVRLCNYMDVYSSDYVSDSTPFMRATANKAEIKRFGLISGDVVITKDSESPDDIAVPTYVAEASPDLVCGYHLAILRPKNGIDGRFLSYLLQNEVVNSHFARAATGSTRYGLSISSIKNAPLHIPRDIDAQRHVARLLSALEEQIDAHLEKMLKLKSIRSGAVRERLLPLAEKSPSCLLGSLCEQVTSGSRGWAAYYSDDGALFLRIGNLTREHPNLRFDDVVRVRVPEGGEGARTRLQEGDLLISITADLGIVASVPPGLGEAYVNQHIALARLSDQRAHPRWVAHALASPFGANQIARLNDGGAKAGLNLPTIRALRVPLPDWGQQLGVVELIDSIDAQIEKEQAHLAKLKLQKQGLLSNLLTPPSQL